MLKKIFLGMLMATALFSLANCAKGKGGGGNASVATTPVCTAGQVYHGSYGCLPTQQCMNMGYGQNYGYYNGQCYQGTQTSASCQGSCPAGSVNTVYGCMPAAVSGQCGSQYSCAGYGQVNGGVAQCVPGIDNGSYYGNNGQCSQVYPYTCGGNQWQQQYQQPVYYQPYYYYQQPNYNNGLYFYWNF